MIYQHNTSFVDMIAKISMCWNAVKKDKPDVHVQAEGRLSFNEHYLRFGVKRLPLLFFNHPIFRAKVRTDILTD